MGIDPYAYLIVIHKTRTAQKKRYAFFFDYYAFMSSFAVGFIVSMTLSASSRVLPTAER